jgi:hypothetical protein
MKAYLLKRGFKEDDLTEMKLIHFRDLYTKINSIDPADVFSQESYMCVL